jgi:hypothetical protein
MSDMLNVDKTGLNSGEDVANELLRFEAVLKTAHWTDNQTFAKAWSGMAVAQMGTRVNFDIEAFAKKLTLLAVSKVIPLVFGAASMELPDSQKSELLEIAGTCQQEGSYEAALEAANRAEKYTRVYEVDLAECVARECAESLLMLNKQGGELAGESIELVAKAICHGADSVFIAIQRRERRSLSMDVRLAKAQESSDLFLQRILEDVVQILIDTRSSGSRSSS